jgi:hypothetical protein
VFNLVVGLAGSLCIALLASISVLSGLVGAQFGFPDPPILALVAVALYALVANFLYTAGWVSELIALRSRPGGTSSFASAAFSTGLLGSVLLTLALGGGAALLSGLLVVLSFVSRPT